MTRRDMPEYRAWSSMRKRCNQPKHKAYCRYGGRGIKICKEWNDFEVFLKDMGKRPSRQHSIDRIDNDGNYEPANCRWTTIKVQQNNTRTNRMIEYHGRTQSMQLWAEEFGVSKGKLKSRLNAGWSMEDALIPENRYDHNITFNGKSQNLTAWAKEIGIHRQTILYRLKIGCTVEEALTMPLKHGKALAVRKKSPRQHNNS